MKRFAVALVLMFAVALPAAAETLAQQVQAEASRLLTQVKSAEATARASAKPSALSPALVSDLQRFGLAASRLSVEIDSKRGPADLRCIFRGMAAETEKQLHAASAATSGMTQAKALASLNRMLSDAVLIAPAVGRPAQANAAANAASPAAQQCSIERNF